MELSLSRKPVNLPAQHNQLVNRPSMHTPKQNSEAPWGKNKSTSKHSNLPVYSRARYSDRRDLAGQ